jgi:hypothetical protein
MPSALVIPWLVVEIVNDKNKMLIINIVRFWDFFFLPDVRNLNPACNAAVEGKISLW